jgi:serine/threonine protein kinase
LEFKELLYIFKRISQILSYYHGLGYNHGDITEGSIYIDQDKKARLMFFP